MADLDSRAKRASSVQILKPYDMAPPLPDGSIDAGDRQHIAKTYAGLAAGAPAIQVPWEFLLKGAR